MNGKVDTAPIMTHWCEFFNSKDRMYSVTRVVRCSHDDMQITEMANFTQRLCNNHGNANKPTSALHTHVEY